MTERLLGLFYLYFPNIREERPYASARRSRFTAREIIKTQALELSTMHRIWGEGKSTRYGKRELYDNNRVKEMMIIASHKDYYVN
jgi:hypothetical protein